MTDRRCVSCWKIKDRNELIKITASNTNGNVVINPDSVTFGRSAYLCYNQSCIEAALKKSKLKLTLFFNNKKLMVKLKISLTKILKMYPFVPRIGIMKYIIQIVIRRSQILITITPN